MTAIPGSRSSLLYDSSGPANVLHSVQGQQLLTALAGFIHNIIQLHSTSINAADPDQITAEKQYASRAASCTVNEEPGLLRTLECFIKSTVEPTSQTVVDVESNFATEKKEESTTAEVELNGKVVKSKLRIPEGLQKVLDETKDGIRSFIFNQLPIRLLAFDLSGHGIRLIDRNEAMQHIMDFPDDTLDGLITKFNAGTGTKSSLLMLIDEHITSHSRYAILSHTWIRDSPGDVVYNEWVNGEDFNPRGLAKITKFCEVAAKDHGLTLGWMDTLCINKESSSELDESIRSMYKWYQNAEICVAYLSEVNQLHDMHKDSWFTRGWTLQELLAPKRMEFYDRDWERLLPNPLQNDLADLPFSMMEDEFLNAIQVASTITEQELNLCRNGQVDRIPISRKFQLAAYRIVTRTEDSVYSLMGLLGVEITIAYGEGYRRSLYRLFRELFNTQRNILDIFNSGISVKTIIPSNLYNYASRTTLFDNIGNEKASFLDQWPPVEPILVTHLGVRIPLLLVPGLVRVGFGPSTAPYGEFWSSILHQFGFTDKYHFDLLCSRIYTDETVTSRRQNIPGDSTFVVTFGVVNIGLDGNDILLPDSCLSLPLNCGIKPVGSVGPSDPIQTIYTPHSAVFQLHSISTIDRVPKSDLEMHGMQLVTLYL